VTRLPLALACLALCGCAHQPEVLLLFGPRVSEGETELGAALIVLQPFGKDGHGVAGYLHDSELLNGEPINRKPDEITIDQPSVGVKWGGK
jgi:hypothetical protein